MKEKANPKNHEFARSVSAILGWVILAIVLWSIVEDVKLSQRSAVEAEVINRAFAGESTLYPGTGTMCRLEARVAEEGVSDEYGWYHSVIAANYGDTIEVRLRVLAADDSTTAHQEIGEQLLLSPTAGLVSVTTDDPAEHYGDSYDRHITYIKAGTYRFRSSDWWAGKTSSKISTVVNGKEISISVIPPYNHVRIALTLVLFGVAVLFGAVLPAIFTIADKKALERAI